MGTFIEEFAKGISLIGTFNGIKLSYFQYDYPLLKPTTQFLNVAVAAPEDIAAMKLVAISDRSTKKDYIDLYTLCHRNMSLDYIFDLYEQKYHLLASNKFTLMKSIVYFKEAEETPMPEMLTPILWNDVEKFFIAESIRLGKKYLG